jgi:uncharacterized membrane protein YeaQ/YmgE (transglycosylase-associated protein family)
MNVTGYLSAILVGAVIGILGRLVLPGRQRLGGFVTFLIGVAAALLGLFLSRAMHLDGKLPVHVWKLHWHWITLIFQVALAVVGIGAANAMTYTRLGDSGTTVRKRATRRRRTTKRSEASR